MLLLKGSSLTCGTAALLTTLLMVSPTQAAGFDRCRVTDPTGTPLNVRAAPQGQVTGTLKNDVLVGIIETVSDSKGQSWVRVADYKSRRPIGWVFREFVACF